MAVNHLPSTRFTAIDVGHPVSDGGWLPHEYSLTGLDPYLVSQFTANPYQPIL
jgi:hypothetical protein